MHRPPGDDMNGTDKFSLIWCMFMSSTMNAAVFLRKDYLNNVHSIKNAQEKPTVKKLFEVSQRLVREQYEISGVLQICWKTMPCERMSLMCEEEVIKISTTKVCVLRLCIPNNAENWIESMENQWNSCGKIPMFTTLEILYEIQKN